MQNLRTVINNKPPSHFGTFSNKCIKGKKLPLKSDTGAYLFGFNGQERDDEVAGLGKINTAEFWEYDVRLGRRWNIDPLFQTQPSWSPYKTFNNNPIIHIDPNGAKEFPTYADYKKELGDKALAEDKWTGQDGHWLTGDRTGTGLTTRWDGANTYNIKNNNKGQYEPFEQVRDFYIWVNKQAKNKGHEVKWMDGATLLVNDLTMLDGPLSVTMPNNTIKILEELNVAICDYAIGKFNELLFGDYSDKPLKGDAAYNWDYAFIIREQGKVAVPIYDLYKRTDPGALVILQRAADHAFFLGVVGFGSALFSDVPSFKPFNGKVTSAGFRIDFPMLMLYPTKHKPTAVEFKYFIMPNGLLQPEWQQYFKK